MYLAKQYLSIFKRKSGALSFFISIIIWGIGIGCFAAALNNYLVDIYSFTKYQRGWLEFFREMPGLLLVFLLALFHKQSDWKILRIGTLISMIAVIALVIDTDKIALTFLIMLWSTGEHIIMPVRHSIAMQVAKPEKAGQSLGFVTSAMNAGTVLGSILVALIFWGGMNFFNIADKRHLYNTVWIFIFILMAVSVVTTFTRNAPAHASKRPRLYFHQKYTKYYFLELFYGARKQIFLTFAPFVLIIEYQVDTQTMAVLMAVCASVNIFMSPLIGKITDKFGYKNIMIYDTVILFFVCLAYGFAGRIFPFHVAVWVLAVNYLLDAVISTTSLATNLYVRDISETKDELTSTLSSGISTNHLISVLFAPLGGWIWARFGVETLFVLAAIMAAGNSLYACTLPRPKSLKA